MIFSYLFPAIVILGISGFFFGRLKAIRVATAQGGIRALHSLPNHYGMLTGLAILIPALLIYGLWISIETSIIDTRVINELPPELAKDSGSASLVLNDIKNTLAGNVTVSKDPEITRAAGRYAEIKQNYRVDDGRRRGGCHSKCLKRQLRSKEIVSLVHLARSSVTVTVVVARRTVIGRCVLPLLRLQSLLPRG